MITAENLRYRNLLINTLRIAPGITSVIGPNGSGKTTLLKLLAGIVVPDTGTLLIDGILPRSTEIGWVNEYPDRNILFGSVSEEVASPLRFRHLPCPIIEDRVRSCLDLVGIRNLETRPMQVLSGGEKVLVALATALVVRPHVLVLDEYDSHLDAGSAARTAGVIRKSTAPYVIHCTQDMETAVSGDAVIYLDKGTVKYAGLPADVFASLDRTAFCPLSWRCRT